MQTSLVQSIKLAVVAATGLEKDALHIYVGLAVFFGAASIARRRLRSAVPWLAVLAMALAGEVIDLIEDLQLYGRWNWAGSLHDVVNTLFWPTVVWLLVRYGRIFRDEPTS